MAVYSTAGSSGVQFLFETPGAPSIQLQTCFLKGRLRGVKLGGQRNQQVGSFPGSFGADGGLNWVPCCPPIHHRQSPSFKPSRIDILHQYFNISLPSDMLTFLELFKQCTILEWFMDLWVSFVRGVFGKFLSLTKTPRNLNKPLSNRMGFCICWEVVPFWVFCSEFVGNLFGSF